MSMRISTVCAVFALLQLTCMSPAWGEHHGDDTAAMVRAALAGDHRSDANRARDEFRDPAETLSFFGLTPDMTVVELWPGGGWYTEVLAPVLRERGRLVAASYGLETEPAYRPRLHKELTDKVAGNPAVYGSVEVIEWDPPRKRGLGSDGSADMVVTFRNMHSFNNAGILDEVLADMYAVLKPGGVLGIVQHRAAADADAAQTSKNGYLPEAFVIARTEAAGFVLEDRSEINANPKDAHDYEGGVWTLPPSYRLGDQDRARYQAIGESDRMTLRFRKPKP